jgi:hypothetical protein
VHSLTSPHASYASSVVPQILRCHPLLLTPQRLQLHILREVVVARSLLVAEGFLAVVAAAVADPHCPSSSARVIGTARSAVPTITTAARTASTVMHRNRSPAVTLTCPSSSRSYSTFELSSTFPRRKSHIELEHVIDVIRIHQPCRSIRNPHQTDNRDTL